MQAQMRPFSGLARPSLTKTQRQEMLQNNCCKSNSRTHYLDMCYDCKLYFTFSFLVLFGILEM